ncbi:HAD family hydrolase [Marinobacter apostichopi]|uniref:HAD family hydrolase n=1 Tax=Marinobacter apostichopi TaxID=3035454 RepID=UPI0025728ECC|nr:HAD family hydrolase [Marinobacter sp. LA51]
MSLPIAISNYLTLVFDCDGVVLDSNKVKTNAFYRATLPYGEAAAQAMVEYHVANGGVSRYKKFAYFLEQIVPGQADSDLAALLEAYSVNVREGLLSCTITPGLEALRQCTPNARWLMASGGDQAELRDVLSKRGLADLFDGGIFGSPDEKYEIIKREISAENILKPALFIGDSKYDYEVSVSAAIDFVFLSDWTEVEQWSRWAQQNKIVCKQRVRDLLDV